MKWKNHNDWTEPIEAYFNYLPSDMQNEVRQFLIRYYKNQHKDVWVDGKNTKFHSDFQEVVELNIVCEKNE